MSRIRLTDMIRAAAFDAHAAVLMAHTKPGPVPKLIAVADKIRGKGKSLTVELLRGYLKGGGLELRSKDPIALENLHKNLMKVRVAYITGHLV